jgi:hypothetical protein
MVFLPANEAAQVGIIDIIIYSIKRYIIGSRSGPRKVITTSDVRPSGGILSSLLGPSYAPRYCAVELGWTYSSDCCCCFVRGAKKWRNHSCFSLTEESGAEAVNLEADYIWDSTTWKKEGKSRDVDVLHTPTVDTDC